MTVMTMRAVALPSGETVPALGMGTWHVFLVSKVLPHHATRDGTIAACESSLRRLDTD